MALNLAVIAFDFDRRARLALLMRIRLAAPEAQLVALLVVLLTAGPCRTLPEWSTSMLLLLNCSNGLGLSSAFAG
jgi:hypothetical protein